MAQIFHSHCARLRDNVAGSVSRYILDYPMAESGRAIINSSANPSIRLCGAGHSDEQDGFNSEAKIESYRAHDENKFNS
jgi:hypothetical protein